MSAALPVCNAEVVPMHSGMGRVAVLDIGVVCRVEGSAELLVRCGRIHPAMGAHKMDAIFQQGL